ncbi:uncharacterized protein LOC8058431 isoform X2 [Sorghum bicolor]|uniref:4Fe-4S ferredoxin-type domain-containing protein n=1 Tax=Sorghum bicolor TaxID=4558 RepID=C5Z746_SORBI|nr:uncharacterized protein LOC8058431 isoform X2 [Sorghum bicolor]EER90134.1 hypothetical protein SORBI_3010G211200 [Sorghum bicolor]|eukprot:XP_002438767.1 uncharacterized protein LOC8058431 isoform X2 [Sorghum bicolor]
MEFGFRAGDRRPRCPSPGPDRRFTPPRAGPFHGEPPPLEWEAAARRERIIREEVERRLIEEEVCRELALARARFHGGYGPVPFVGPDGLVVPPPPSGPFYMPDGPFPPPMPLPLMPVGMHPNRPPPSLFGSWEGFGPRRLPGFGQPMHPNETRTGALPPPKPRHQLQLRESSEVLSSEANVSGVKRKADASSATTKPTKLQNASSATTEPTKLQNAARDWSCALCQVSATSEAGLNQHIQGKKHKAKLVQCGAIKVKDTKKSGLQVTTGNNNGASPSDAPKKIHILVDGEMHQVVQKSNCVRCERCRVSCTNAAAMADHLRGKKHSFLNKVWTSIKAVRMNKEDSAATSTCERKVNEDGPAVIPEELKEEDTYMTSELCGDGSFEIPMEMKETTDKESKEDSAATCERKVNEDGPAVIPEALKEEDTYMTSELCGDGSFEIPMEMKETTDMAEEVDANSHNVIPMEIKKEDTASEVNGNCAVETKQEGTDVDVVMDVNKNFLLKVHQKSRNKASKIFLSKVHQKSRKKASKKFLLKLHQKSRKKANKNFLLKVHQKPRPTKWLGIREVNENSSIEIPAEEKHMTKPQMQPTDSTEPARKEE